MRLTPAVLLAAMGCTPARAELWAQPLGLACERYGIDTPQRLAHFIAQVGHESGSLRHVREIWGPTPAQASYEGRHNLGNVQPGDGARYMGRGPIQLTGRANYAAARDRMRNVVQRVPDFEAEPETVEQPQWGALVAAEFWHRKGCNLLADADNFELITRRVNGGTNGIDDRRTRLVLAKAALIDQAAAQAAPAPPPIPTQQQTPASPPAPSWQSNTSEGDPMPIPAFIGLALPAIIDAIPKLGRIFGSGSEVAERNVRAAELAVGIAQDAIGARNAQELTETLARDPEAREIAKTAVEARWFEIAEAGGGGIDGARKADLAFAGSGRTVLQSPSFWAGISLLPLAYMTAYSVLFTEGWASDVRATIAATIISLVVGSIAGYYFGSTTKGNTPGRQS